VRGEKRRERAEGEWTGVNQTFLAQHQVYLCVMLVIWMEEVREDMTSATSVDET